MEKEKYIYLVTKEFINFNEKDNNYTEIVGVYEDIENAKITAYNISINVREDLSMILEEEKNLGITSLNEFKDRVRTILNEIGINFSIPMIEQDFKYGKYGELNINISKQRIIKKI